MGLIDTHAHLTFNGLFEDLSGVLERSRAAGVDRWITVGTDPEQSRRAVEVAGRNEGVFAAVGVHPHHAQEISEGDLDVLGGLLREEKVVAVGETGLDFHYDFSHRDAQKRVFRAQLRLAAEAGLPVVVHSRNAFDEVVGILDEFGGSLKNVVFHCYSGDMEQATLLLERGWHVSFTGIVTFKKSDEARRVAAAVPLDRMMIETDCPYISPEPVRNKRPCEPAMLVYTAKKIAELHRRSLGDFGGAVAETSRRFFGLP